MLVSINPQVGAVSGNYTTRFHNFMAALHSVATCAAGGTPTAVNPVKSSDGTKDTTLNCITVLSNTEAGGWTAGFSNNITAATAYNASSTSLIVDLYQASGKASAPWLRQTFGNFSYGFNSGSFDSYHHLQYIQGHTTASNNPATIAYNGTDSGNYTGGTTASVRPTGAYTGYYNYFPVNIVEHSQIYVAVTASYLIIVTPIDIAYYGIRDQAGWELTRSDNPAWCAFGYTTNQSAYYQVSSYRHVEYCWAYMAGIYPDGTQTSASKRGAQIDANSSSGEHRIAGSNGGGRNSTTYMRNLFPIAAAVGGAWTSYPNIWMPESPITDPVTGLTVPPAYPIIFNWADGGYAASGQVPGIYKGMTTTPTGLTQFASASEYVIAGTSYVPVRTGHTSYPDLFLLRKA